MSANQTAIPSCYGGYTCPYCGMFVPINTVHYCQNAQFPASQTFYVNRDAEKIALLAEIRELLKALKEALAHAGRDPQRTSPEEMQRSKESVEPAEESK